MPGEPTGELIACEDCGAVYRRRALAHGEIASCTRCKAVLWRHSRLGLGDWLALALAALLVFAIANAYPVAAMSVGGAARSATLLEAVAATWRQGYALVALMSGLSAFALPLAHLLVLLWILVPLAAGRRPAGFAPATRLLEWLRPWCMVPVFLLGVVVAVVKLADMAAVTPGAGLAAFAALMVLLTVLGRLDAHALWRHAEQAGVVAARIAPAAPSHHAAGGAAAAAAAAAHGAPQADGGSDLRPQELAGCHACGLVQAAPAAGAHAHCGRCGAVLHARKPDHLARTWALLAAAAILYLPANLYPVMTTRGVTGSSSHTILGGVVELWTYGSWDIALIVFVASVMVPLTKLLALALLAWTTQRGGGASLVARTRMYRMVEFVGQWSMLDVYVVVLLSALADFGGLMRITAGVGAAAFGMVVILTMLAAMSFDPRAAWDNPGPQPIPEPARGLPPAPARQAPG